MRIGRIPADEKARRYRALDTDLKIQSPEDEIVLKRSFFYGYFD
jgi:hypothetical protein